MGDISRRAVLGRLAVGAGAGASSGCLFFGPVSCGAAGPHYHDDVLRVRIDSIEATTGGFAWNGAVAQPGSEGWRYDDRSDGRTEFNTSYSGVVFRAYALDGTELVTRDLGRFEAGVSRRIEATTGRFPDLITATVSSVNTGYPGGCEEARTGVDIRGYAGHHPADWSPGDRWGPEFRRSARPETERAGHRWHPHGTLAVGETPPLDREWFRRTLCLQRVVAGRERTPGSLSIVPDIERRVARNETYRVTLYRYLSQATYIDRREEPAAIPDWIRDLYHDTDWEAMDDGDPTIFKTEPTVSRDQFRRLYSTLEGKSTPTMPPFGYDQGHNHYPGHCREGGVWRHYRLRIGDEPSALTLSYTWTGPQVDIGGESASG